VSIIPAELTTVTAMADKVVRVDDPDPWLLHVEFQAQHDESLPRRIYAYNAALTAKHDVPVASVAVLISPAANARNLTGELRLAPPLGRAWAFPYTVVRLWQLPTEPFLTGAPQLLPLALLTDVDAGEVMRTAERVHDRLLALNDPALTDTLMTTLTLLLPARYDDMTAQQIIDGLGIRGLEQNPGIKAWIDRGRVEGREEAVRAMILRQGTARFGKPTKRVAAKLAAVTDPVALEDLGVRLLTVPSWKELFASPTAAV